MTGDTGTAAKATFGHDHAAEYIAELETKNRRLIDELRKERAAHYTTHQSALVAADLAGMQVRSLSDELVTARRERDAARKALDEALFLLTKPGRSHWDAMSAARRRELVADFLKRGGLVEGGGER